MTRPGTEEWFQRFHSTGAWCDDPPFWREPAYLATRPWPPEEIDAAFTALRALYPPQVVKPLVDGSLPHDPRHDDLYSTICSAALAVEHDAFLELGLDVIDAGAMSEPCLREDLRNPTKFRGARFELAILAAARRANVPLDYDPLRKAGGQRPDYRLNLDEAAHVEAKAPYEAVRIKQERGWLRAITDLGRPLPNGRETKINLLPSFKRLQDDADGRRRLTSLIDTLRDEVRAAVGALAAHDAAGARVIRDLVEVEVGEASNQNTSGAFSGVPTDAVLEAQRILRGAILDACSQLPKGRETGVVLVRPDFSTAPGALAQEVRRWFVEEGQGYREVAGVALSILVYPSEREQLPDSVEVIAPIWRASAPEWLKQGPWARLTAGLNVDSQSRNSGDEDQDLSNDNAACPS